METPNDKLLRLSDQATGSEFTVRIDTFCIY